MHSSPPPADAATPAQGDTMPSLLDQHNAHLHGDGLDGDGGSATACDHTLMFNNDGYQQVDLTQLTHASHTHAAALRRKGTLFGE